MRLRLPSFDQLLRDVRVAARALRHSPGFAFAVVALLGLGIGLGTAVFTVVYSMVARPLPIRDPARVVNVYQHLGGHYSREVNGAGSFLSYEEFQQYSRSPVFAATAAYHETELGVRGVTDGLVPSQLVSCGYFRTLGVRMALGRPLAYDECTAPGDGHVVVLSHELWQTRFGSDSSLVGRTIEVNGLPLTVVGVTEPRFHGIALVPASMWVPVTMEPALDHGGDSLLLRPNASWLVMTARLAPGVSAREARAQLALVAARRDRLYPGRVTTVLVRSGALLNFPEVERQGGVPLALALVLGMVVLAMACVNATGLAVARAVARRREVGIRVALGASRPQIVRYLVAETALLAVGGEALGLALAAALPRALGGVSAVAAMQIDASPDLRVVAVSLASAIGALMLVGVVPALHAARTDPVRALKGDAGFGGRIGRPSRLRGAVAAAQVAASALLLVVAALFLRASLRGASIDPGFTTRNVVAFSFNAGSLRMSDERVAAVYREMTTRLMAASGAEGVALAARLPLLQSTTWTVEPDGGRPDGKRTVEVVVASPSYLATMGIRLLHGVPFDSAAHGDAREAVVSGSLAAALWPELDPIGRRFEANGGWYRVVGIAAETRETSLASDVPCIYVAPPSPRDMELIVRTRGEPSQLLADVPRWARAIDAELVVHAERIEDRVAAALLPARVVAAAMATLGALALFLAAVGLWGIVTFGVAQRRRELAIRIAVGARGGQVIGLMMRQATRSAAWGLGAGVVLAGLFALVVRSFLLGLDPFDPIAFVAVAAAVFLMVVLSTFVPSLRALRFDPSALLRGDG